MQTFTGWEYLCLDIANNHHSGLDKKTYEERLLWVGENLRNLEDEALGNSWKEKPLYLKAVSALRKAQKGKPTGHLVGFDAVCSGMQLMAVMTGCRAGATATGLVDRNRRADAYTDCTNLMANIMGGQINIERKKVKAAVMTSLYGSKMEPIKLFGQDTPELQAFYEAMMQLCPGPVSLLDAFVSAWQPYAKAHSWTLPDGYYAHVKVMQERKERIEIEELNGASFTFQYYENEGSKKDCKLAANITHSVDAYVLRSLIRRCNYDKDLVETACNVISDELVLRGLDRKVKLDTNVDELSDHAKRYWEHYARSGMIDPLMVGPDLTMQDLRHFSDEYLKKLRRVLSTMLEHRPFEIITIHDDFKCHPNNLNFLRRHYNDILADLAESHVAEDILYQITGFKYQFNKDWSLPDTIRNANYALC